MPHSSKTKMVGPTAIQNEQYVDKDKHLIALVLQLFEHVLNFIVKSIFQLTHLFHKKMQIQVTASLN